MNPITVTPARAEDLPEVAFVLADAFHDDPVLRAIVPGYSDRRSILAHVFSGMMHAGPFQTGKIDVARQGTQILGAAAWEGPEAAHGAFGRQLRQLPRFVRALGWSRLPRALQLLTRLEKNRPSSPHWYLAEVGVSAQARGLGIGTRLLTHRLEELDRSGQMAYLESSTPENRKLYRRLGFRDSGTITGIPGASPERMIRVPQ